jgi:hypothetical protein
VPGYTKQTLLRLKELSERVTGEKDPPTLISKEGDRSAYGPELISSIAPSPTDPILSASFSWQAKIYHPRLAVQTIFLSTKTVGYGVDQESAALDQTGVLCRD